MCGICGIQSVDESARVCRGRESHGQPYGPGPDDAGFWADPQVRLQLGFRRWSILDLTSTSHHPQISADGLSVNIINGEIYNFQELRHALEGAGLRFRSPSNTEGLLETLNLRGASLREVEAHA
jgi:asparagine synthase (glutamine-hydrolysing)